MTDGYRLDGEAPAARALQADYLRRSETVTALPGARLNLACGPHPRHRLDVFSAGSNAPVLVFFHGGYWRAGSKDARRFPAPHWVERGVSWVCVNYRLVPEFKLADAVADARRAVVWLAGNAKSLGLDPDQLHVTGNSAGAHLAAMVAAAGAESATHIRSLSVISGLFDLVPLVEARANDWLRITEAEARDLSPSEHLPPSEIPVLVGVGGVESAEFKHQSRLFAEACSAAGNHVTQFESPGADHFQIIGEYGARETPLFRHLSDLVTSG